MKMNPNKTGQKPSSLYYSLRKLPLKEQEAIIRIHAFYRQIFQLIIEHTEPAIARMKLQWWRDEVDKAYDNKAEHPIAKAISQTLKHFKLNKAYFFEIINGFESLLDHPTFETPKDLFHFYSRTAGSRELLCFSIFGSTEGLEKTAYEFGAGLEIIHNIRNLRLMTEKGFCFFAERDMKINHCSQDELSQLKMTSNIENLLKQQAKRAKDYLNTDSTNRYISRMLKLYLELLNAIELEHFEVLKQHIKLNPLKKLWLSFRCA